MWRSVTPRYHCRLVSPTFRGSICLPPKCQHQNEGRRSYSSDISGTATDHSVVKTNSVLRRALLYLPGNNKKMAKKAAGLNVDCVCLDLEDAVSLNRKEEARASITEILAELDFGDSDVAVRINPLMTELAEADIKALYSAPTLPKSLVIPKVETSIQMEWLFDMVDKCMKDDLIDNMNVLIQVESPLGLINLKDICRLDMDAVTESLQLNLEGLIFGGDDFAASLGATRSEAASELFFARQSVVCHAKAFGLQAIDLVNIHYHDTEFLERESIEGAHMGYTGKQIIHPNQVDIVQAAFSPSKASIDFALALEHAFEVHQNAGHGAFTFRDKMIDMPTMLQCQTVLNLARRTGMIAPKEIRVPDPAPKDAGSGDVPP
eukprot:m.784290 g.784290  ORF g.784290 m.784290 type:complete len:377 (-) comp23297_c0_seq6:334-1464(-)